jgi:hypothetical protein
MIMSKQVQVKKNEIPEGWSVEAADFVNRVVIILNIVTPKKASKQAWSKRSYRS